MTRTLSPLNRYASAARALDPAATSDAARTFGPARFF
jgi:hypothetical protein